jgi:hypothetical protein
MRLPTSLRRYGLLALAAFGGYVLHSRRARRRTHGSPDLPVAVRNFVAMLAKRGVSVVDIRRGADRRGWIVEWQHGRSLYFPDEE